MSSLSSPTQVLGTVAVEYIPSSNETHMCIYICIHICAHVAAHAYACTVHIIYVFTYTRTRKNLGCKACRGTMGREPGSACREQGSACRELGKRVSGTRKRVSGTWGAYVRPGGNTAQRPARSHPTCLSASPTLPALPDLPYATLLYSPTLLLQREHRRFRDLRQPAPAPTLPHPTLLR